VAWVVAPAEHKVEKLNRGGSGKETHRWMVPHTGVRDALGVPKGGWVAWGKRTMNCSHIEAGSAVSRRKLLKDEDGKF